LNRKQVGLLGPDGDDLPLHLEGQGAVGTSTVLRCDAASNSFTFTDVPVEPVPSLLRGFSAPVKLEVEGQTDEQLQLMFAHDSDTFNRWVGRLWRECGRESGAEGRRALKSCTAG
jgi:aminopeptidase N